MSFVTIMFSSWGGGEDWEDTLWISGFLDSGFSSLIQIVLNLFLTLVS